MTRDLESLHPDAIGQPGLSAENLADMIGTVRYSAFSEPLQARALAAIFVAAVILRR